MDKISNLKDIWNNGAISPFNLTGEDIDAFKQKHGSSRVTEVQWDFRGITYRSDKSPRPLPDYGGLIYGEGPKQWSKLIVLNGDATQRCVIKPPVVDHDSQPEKGWVWYPEMKDYEWYGGIRHGFPGSDGARDYLFQFDWYTGALVKAAPVQRNW